MVLTFFFPSRPSVEVPVRALGPRSGKDEVDRLFRWFLSGLRSKS